MGRASDYETRRGPRGTAQTIAQVSATGYFVLVLAAPFTTNSVIEDGIGFDR